MVFFGWNQASVEGEMFIGLPSLFISIMMLRGPTLFFPIFDKHQNTLFLVFAKHHDVFLNVFFK